MRIHKFLTAGLPAVVGLALLAPAPTQATNGRPAAPACAHICVWSGPNYTGTEANVPVPPKRACYSASSLGLDAIRSAVTPDYFPADFWSPTCGGDFSEYGGALPNLPRPAGGISVPLKP